jgi:sporulation protein YlmC with PRC-barrel domain
MSPEPRIGRASEILGRPVYDGGGELLGRISDLVTEPAADGTHRVTAALVVRGPWGRLLGYERDERTGPWILEHLARIILRRNTTRIPWPDLHLSRSTDLRLTERHLGDTGRSPR